MATASCSRTARSCGSAGKPEPLVEITAASAHELARLAWHIGNRHTDAAGRWTGGCASAATMCSRTCCAGWARGSRRSRRRSIRKPVPMGPSSRRAAMSRAASPARGRRALSPDGLAVAGLSDRRVLLFERHRMGGRGRRHHRRDVARALARRDDRRRRRILRRGVLCPRPSRRRRRRRHRVARGRRACRRLRALEGAPSGDHRAGSRLPRDDARGLAVAGARSARCGLGWRGRAAGRGRRRLRGPRRAAGVCRCTPICRP